MLTLQQLESINAGNLVAIVAVVMGCLIAIVGIVAGSANRIARTRAREQTRREVAAYVAEGSMTADDARKLLDAGESADQFAPPRRP